MTDDDEANYETIERVGNRLSKLENKINSDIEIKENINSEINEDLWYRINQRIKVLESKARYSDSLYFEMLNELVLIENIRSHITIVE